MGKLGRCALLFWIIATPRLLAATVYYVSTEGNDSYNGLYSSYMGGVNGAWRTLAKAAPSLKPGDLLKIRGGTYSETVNFGNDGTAGARITVTSYDGETAIIDGGYSLPSAGVYYFLVTVSGDYVTLSNIIIRRSAGSLLALTGDGAQAIGVRGEGSREAGMYARGSQNLFSGCSMTDSGNGYGLNGQTTWGSAIGSTGVSTLIENCLAHDNRGEGFNAGGAGYGIIIQDCIAYDNGALNIYNDSADGTIIRRNLVYCTPGAKYGPSSGIVIGAEVNAPSNLQIVNNLCLGNWLNLVTDSNVTVADNFLIAHNTFVNTQKTAADLSSGYNMGVYFRPQLASFVNSRFENNVIVEEGSGRVPINTTLAAAHSGFIFGHNCWNKAPTAAAMGTGDVIADPLLARSGSTAAGALAPGWFKILDNSPARDRAVALSQVEDDYFGTARGSAPDMGAYELAYTVTSVSASADGSPTSGPAPLAVSFTGSAGGGTPPYSYGWSFGDGGSASVQSPTHTYASAGSFTATLTVTDSASSTASATVNITVTASTALTANIIASPVSGPAPLAVSFAGSAAGGRAPYSYSWAPGDGAVEAAQNPAHIYSTAGSYTATLTVTDSMGAKAAASVNISVSSTTGLARLSVGAETGSPAAGQGGTTDPPPGNYTYATASSTPLKSLPNADYRFSKWTGDIETAVTFDAAASLTMDFDKSVTAVFCSKCADVTGDLKITPADAQAAFDIYLGKVSNPTWCELENADVKCDGTRLEPRVTPSDAQWILNKYLKKGGLDSDCSGKSRTAAVSAPAGIMAGGAPAVTLGNGILTRAGDILVPVFVEAAAPIDSFGLDLAFPSSALQFIGLETGELTADFAQLGAHVVAEGPAAGDASGRPATDPGLLRIGGYRTAVEPIPASGVLVTLVFRGTGEAYDLGELAVLDAQDGLRNASFANGRPLVRWERSREVDDTRARRGAGKSPKEK